MHVRTTEYLSPAEFADLSGLSLETVRPRLRDGGRANRPSLGRHSLGTRDRVQAVEALRELDLAKAVETGRADRNLLARAAGDLLDLGRGRDLYQSHVGRPRVVGGARPKTARRY